MRGFVARRSPRRMGRAVGPQPRPVSSDERRRDDRPGATVTALVCALAYDHRRKADDDVATSSGRAGRDLRRQ